ncbi:uncharacterized protein LOC132757406 [Ruditapes philippinarum]|uniref:uncharacterized protein LOC132757406 n=1 Tax=Ruditapes philippinarum TaxID=129788 RepID=UPI00295ACC5B|nr:uncharacterized protein LOC132757406 [Ruditapes philippinarum]
MNSCVYLILISFWTFCSSEPECSKFHYEERTLEKIIKTEFIVERLKSDVSERDGITKAALEKNQEDLAKIKNDLIDLEDRHDKECKAITEKASAVAFKASNLKNLNPSTGETLIFTTTHFDNNTGYDNTTGIYTAATRGLYLFTCQLCVYQNKRVQIQLVQGQTTVNSMYTDGGKMSGACRRMVDVLVLNTNEQVRIKVGYFSGSTVFWENSSGTNIFSGVLISI